MTCVNALESSSTIKVENMSIYNSSSWLLQLFFSATFDPR